MSRVHAINAMCQSLQANLPGVSCVQNLSGMQGPHAEISYTSASTIRVIMTAFKYGDGYAYGINMCGFHETYLNVDEIIAMLKARSVRMPFAIRELLREVEGSVCAGSGIVFERGSTMFYVVHDEEHKSMRIETQDAEGPQSFFGDYNDVIALASGV